MRRTILTALALALAVPAAAQAAGHGHHHHRKAAPAASSYTLRIRTVPPLRRVRFLLDDRPFAADARGVAQVTATPGLHRLHVLRPTDLGRAVRASFARWGDDAFQPSRTVDLTGDTSLEVGFELDYLAQPRFVDLQGHPVDPRRVSSVTTTSTLGSRNRFVPGRSRWLIGSRVARRSSGLEPTQIQYSVESVVVDGTNVVHHAQQRFYPSKGSQVRIRLLLYSARISARDLFFGFPIGRSILLKYPDGETRRLPLHHGRILLPALARGTYGVKVEAPGYSAAVPVSVSKNQVVALRVVSYLDIGAGSLGALFFLFGLLLLRRPHLRARLAGLAGLLALGALVAAAPASAGVTPSRPIPTFAYYYIWYDHPSWRRAKRDYPLLGRYSSDDPAVVRRHIEWAKQAGIGGFIVSWKSTPKLDRRLALLVRSADAEHFKLALIYQGLDFHRNPLPPSRIERDLHRFAALYSHDPAFALYSKPLVIWSGTWRFAPHEVAQVTAPLRDKLLVLASEKSVAGYNRLASAVDGDAYYWSSVNPATYPGYRQKLAAMSRAVHARGGLWIAPAAPGFDARLVGGARVVDRHKGDTLRSELTAAYSSSPDLVGLISWNEFSENSEVEPTVRFGRRYLDVLAKVLASRFTVRGDFDSSDQPSTRIGYGVPFLIGLLAVLLTCVGAALWRREVKKVARNSI